MSGGAAKLLEDFEKIDDTDYGDGPKTPQNEDDDFDDNDEDEEEEEGHEPLEDSDDSDDDDSTEAQTKAPKAKTSKEAKAQEAPAAVRRLPNGVHVDAKGNVVDPRDGTIIARAGSERRLFEKNMRSVSALDMVKQENETLKKQIDAHTYLDGVPKKFNLDTNDVQSALALAAVYKQNPVEAARNMVEMVLALGHNVTEILGQDAGNALEMGAVRQMIQEHLAPVVKPVQDQNQQQQRQQAAERELQKFVSEHEHSDLHLVVIDRMLGENDSLTPEKAYYELKLFCARKGLDFTQPLQPQFAAAMQRQNGGTQQPARRRASLPNGRPSTSAHRSMDDTVQADVNQSWGDIIKSSM